MLFFDLPVETSSQQRKYRQFVKNIKKLGFYMLQKSVYVKMSIDQRSAESVIKQVETFIPNSGNVAILMITEKQFNDINFLLGDNLSEIISTDERYIEL